MFCPNCKDEFRPGFTHCATCDVDLVESLADGAGHDASAPESPPAGLAAPAQRPVISLREYCGFTTLDDAREARDRLGGEKIYSDIVIRQQPGSAADPYPVEEFWLRIDGDRYKEVFKLLGVDEVPAGEDLADEPFTCGGCGADVSSSESFCSGCGARFEDD